MGTRNERGLTKGVDRRNAVGVNEKSPDKSL